MSGMQQQGETGQSDSMLRFIMTLIVSTAMVALAAWVLSYAVLAPERMGAAHGAASAQHMRS